MSSVAIIFTNCSRNVTSQGMKEWTKEEISRDKNRFINELTNATTDENQIIVDCSSGSTRQNIANTAIANYENPINRRNWLTNGNRFNFGPGKPKCNQFVWEVTAAVGANPGLPNHSSDLAGIRSWLHDLYPDLIRYEQFPPSANQWASKDRSVIDEGWCPLEASGRSTRPNPSPGDVVAKYGIGMGHVSIVTGYQESIGTAYEGIIDKTDFGFRDQEEVFWRWQE